MTRGRKPDPKRARRDTGHRAKPGELKKLPSATRSKAVVVSLRGDEVLPPPDAIAPPADLPEGAVPIWHALIADLAPDFRRPSDLEAFRAFCTIAHRARQATAIIERLGMVVTGERGPMLNPVLTAERDALRDLVRIADQLGLTMGARLRLGLVAMQGASMQVQLERELGRRE